MTKIIDNTTRRKNLILILLATLSVVVAVTILELSNVTHLFHSKETAVKSPTANGETKGEPSSPPVHQRSNSPSPSASENTTQVVQDKSSNGSNNPTITLTSPNGNFISAHRLQLDSPISSVCNTTPGATCEIAFVKDSIIKSLPSEAVDRGGTAYWDRITPRSIGLTQGTWKIQATAKLGDQTKTAKDSLDLEVSP